MDKDYIKNNKAEVQKEPADSKNVDDKNDKNYDYLEPGDTYSFEVGM